MGGYVWVISSSIVEAHNLYLDYYHNTDSVQIRLLFVMTTMLVVFRITPERKRKLRMRHLGTKKYKHASSSTANSFRACFIRVMTARLRPVSAFSAWFSWFAWLPLALSAAWGWVGVGCLRAVFCSGRFGVSSGQGLPEGGGG